MARSRAFRNSKALVLDGFIPYRLNVLAALTSEGLSRLYAPYGITIPEWRILATLGDMGSASAANIGAHSHMHKTKVSRAVAALVDRGLVARTSDSTDLRSAILRLTADGQRIHAAIAAIALTYQAQLLEGLDPGDRAAVERALGVLTARSQALLGGASHASRR